eukprot:6617024-Prorocentrum_lima.AAC.1
MTSSLVGSEMCIRDSSGGPRVPQKGPLTVGALRGDDEDASPLKAQAVSYTHLTLPTICSV